MNLKSIVNFFISRFFWLNILVLVVVCVSFYFGLSIWLGHYTHHGEKVEVPNVMGMNIAEASDIELGPKGLSYEIIDSVYDVNNPNIKPGHISEQEPIQGTFVKKGRKVYLTVRSKYPRKVSFPDLRNVSTRQARLNMRNLGFTIEEVERKPSAFPDLVMDIKYKGKSVEPGERFYKGSSFTLVAGKVQETVHMNSVPALNGLSIQAAKDTLMSHNFIVGDIIYDVTPISNEDKALYLIYHIDPQASSSAPSGSRINLWVSKDATKEYKVSNDTEDEEFF